MFFTPGIGPMDILFLLTMIALVVAYAIGWCRGHKVGRKDGYVAGLRKGQKRMVASKARRY